MNIASKLKKKYLKLPILYNWYCRRALTVYYTTIQNRLNTLYGRNEVNEKKMWTKQKKSFFRCACKECARCDRRSSMHTEWIKKIRKKTWIDMRLATFRSLFMSHSHSQYTAVKFYFYFFLFLHIRLDLHGEKVFFGWGFNQKKNSKISCNWIFAELNQNEINREEVNSLPLNWHRNTSFHDRRSVSLHSIWQDSCFIRTLW